MTVQLDPFAILPLEISQEILLRLPDAREVGRCSTVSPLWNRAVDNDVLWKKLVPGTPLPARGVKAFIDRYAVNSLLGVCERIEAFVRIVPWNHSGSFRCYFPFNPGSSVQVDIGEQREGIYHEVCIYMRQAHDPEGKTQTLRSTQNFQDFTGCKITVILPEIVRGNGLFVNEISERVRRERIQQSHENWRRVLALGFGFLSLVWLSLGE